MKWLGWLKMGRRSKPEEVVIDRSDTDDYIAMARQTRERSFNQRVQVAKVVAASLQSGRYNHFSQGIGRAMGMPPESVRSTSEYRSR